MTKDWAFLVFNPFNPMNKNSLDRVGQETLERLAKIDAYSLWQFRMLEPFLGARVMEIGSGIGNISRFFLGRDRVLLTDVSESYLGSLVKTFGSHSEVRVAPFDLESGRPDYRDERMDTIVCMNVLEHIQDDHAALRFLYDQLILGGRLCLLVPAHPGFFGTLDHALGHFRRYTRRQLDEKIQAAGFQLEKIFFFNRMGLFGWWLNGKILKKEILPENQLGWFGKFIPVLSMLDRLLPFPFGISLIAIARK